MEIKKTGKLFSFCCAVPAIIKKKNNKDIKNQQPKQFPRTICFLLCNGFCFFPGFDKNLKKPQKLKPRPASSSFQPYQKQLSFG